MSALPASSHRMLRAEPSTELQAQEKRGSTVLQSSEEAPLAGLDLNAVICIALARAGISHKEACALMGVDQALWTKQRSGTCQKGDDHVSLQRLMKLPRKFWNEFLPLVGDPLQICMSSADMADLAMLRILTLMEEVGTYTLRLRNLRRTA